MQGKQTKRNASEPWSEIRSSEAWRHRRRRFSLSGKLNEFSPAVVMLRGESMAGRNRPVPELRRGKPRLYGNVCETKCLVEMRLAVSGSGESAYF